MTLNIQKPILHFAMPKTGSTELTEKTIRNRIVSLNHHGNHIRDGLFRPVV